MSDGKTESNFGDQRTPDLSEADRLLQRGFNLVRLEHLSKRPAGMRWNDPNNFAKSIDSSATGYGLPLAANGLCSIDPDNWMLAKAGMEALGFDLEEIMNAGARTKSTRPNSGGRSVFRAIEGISWTKFSSADAGVILELRATSPNLQDVIPGVVYRDKDDPEVIHSQIYAGNYRLDEAPELPVALQEFWRRCSDDVDFLHEVQKAFGAKISKKIALSVSTGVAKSQLGFGAPGIRSEFNQHNNVKKILSQHGYEFHSECNRWSAPNSTGAPGIRPIPGKTDLWQSDHASDPLCGTFDAWSAHVQLNHGGHLDLAVSEFRRSNVQAIKQEFRDLRVDAQSGDLLPNVESAAEFSWELDLPIKHPLARFVALDYKPRLPEFVVDDFISIGLTVIAGHPGSGKTTNLLPIAAAVAHLCPKNYPLRPVIRRKVVWITEDVDQVERCLAGLISQGWARPDDFSAWFMVVQASRMSPADIALVAPFYAQTLSNHINPPEGDAMTVKPLVVFDTSNAVIDVDNENDNAEIGRAIARIKEAFPGFPVWLISHVAKGMFASKPEDMTSRGASAWGGDANQTCYLVVNQDGSRSLKRGKTRFESKWSEINFKTTTVSMPVPTPFGLREVQLRYSEGTYLEPGQMAEIEQERKDQEKSDATQSLRSQILHVVRTQFDLGIPISKTALRSKISGNTQAITVLIDSMINEGWLLEYELSDAIRKQLGRDGRSKYALQALSETEYQEYLQTHRVPESVFHRRGG